MLKLIQPLRLTLVITLLSASLANNTNSTINPNDSSTGHLNLTQGALNQSSIQANSSLPQKSLSDVHPIDQSKINCFSDDEIHKHISSFVNTNTLQAQYEFCIQSCHAQRNQSLSTGVEDDVQCTCKSILKGNHKEILVPIKPRYARDDNKNIIGRPVSIQSQHDLEKPDVKEAPSKEISVLNKKSSVKTVIRINGQHFVPIKNKTVKPIVVEGVTYIPVHSAPEYAHKGSAIVPKTSGHIETFKIGKITYIPLNVIPKVYRSAFKPAKKAALKKSSVKTVIRINGQHYVPIKNKTVKPIVVEGVTYIPVHAAPESAHKGSAIVPKTSGHIETFKIGKITYIPINVIPKIYRSAFKPAKKAAPKKSSVKTVIRINGEHYIPIQNKTIKPIVVEGVTYIPVHSAPESAHNGSAIVPKTSGHIETFKIGKITYIPLHVIPKLHRAVFKPVKKAAQKKSSVKTVIKINGQHYVPIHNKTVKPIVVEGVTYIPVHTAPESVNKSSAIVPKKTGHIDTFKVGKITYIPLNVIPKVHRQIFKPVKKVTPPVIKINGKFYIPVKKNAKPIVVEGRTYIPVHTAPSHLKTSSPIHPKTEEPVATFKIGNKTYIPLEVIPKTFAPAFTKKNKTSVISINGAHYIPVKNPKKIVVDGITYIPVRKAPSNLDVHHVISSNGEDHTTFKIGNKTYIPLKAIPKVYRNAFSPTKKPSKPLVKPPKAVISINGEHFVPITNLKVKPIVIDGRTYIPVKYAPASFNSTKVVTPTKEGKVVTFKIGNRTYIPLDVVPKPFQSVFKNKKASKVSTQAKVSKPIQKVKPVAKQPKVVIKINDGHYIPITRKNVKPIVVEGISYIPVHIAPDYVNKSGAIASNKNGTVNIFKIGNITYIPLHVVPKVFQSIFKNKVNPVKKPTKKEIAHPAINIDGVNYIPKKSSVQPIVENGVTYIPVNRAPAGKTFKSPNLPTCTVAPITKNGQTYIPASQIPKILLPLYKKTIPVIKVGDQHFVPIKNQTVHPLVIDGVKYIPVKLANASHHDIGSAITAKSQGNINTFKIGNLTYIPLSVVPKVYRKIFKTVKKPSPPSKAILINGKSYSPITNTNVKPITIEGVQYIPVKHVNHTQNENNTIVPEVEGKLNTFKIGNKTYIPLSAIPKKHQSYFKRVVTPAKKLKAITPILKINDLHVVPITSKTVKKIVVDGVTYIPVKLAGKSLNKNHSIVPDVDGKINTFKVGKQLYIPLSVVPNVYAPIFRNRIVPVNNHTVSKTVIQINGQHFVPITDKKHRQVILGGITYVPVHSVSASHDITTPIVANKKVNTFQVGKITYVPLVVIPKVYRAVFNYKVTPIKKSSTPVIKINGAHFVPIRGQNVKPIFVEGVSYIPVHPVPKHVDTSRAIVNENEGSINTFKIGSKTYIPISVIPKVHRAIFRNKVKPANVTRKITTVISINGNHFVPINNKTVKPIHLDGVTYLPVHTAPYYLDVKKPISAKVDGHINTFKFGNVTYIPVHAIPKIYLPIFKNKPVKATPKSVNKYVISINGKTYKPITNSTSKHVVVNGKVYIPVHRYVNSVVDKRVITPNHEEGQVNTFKIRSKTYIPLALVPKAYKAVFAYKVSLPVKKGPKQQTIIKVNGQHFVPLADKSVKPVVVDGKTFVPVKVAPEHFNVSKAIAPKKQGEIQTFKIGEHTYIPLAVIPKKHRANFKQANPKAKSAPILTVIKVNNVHYTPITKGNVKPIKIDGKFYVPVNLAPESLDVKNPLKPTKSGKVKTLKIAGQTYIPLAVLPKVYKPIFLNKPVKVTLKSVKNHVISINGKTFKPITDSQHNQIVVGGKVYVPVHHIETDKIGTKNVITPNQAKKVNTFKVGNKTYIPLEHIPKSYRPIFNYKVKQVKVVRSSIGITINGQNYIPITNKTVNPTIINGKHYIPVHIAPDNVVIKKTIQTSEDTKINTIKIGKLTYIPLSVIPKKHRAVFKNRAVPNLKTSPKVVIKVNGQQYHPITNKKVKPIVIDDRVYIPVHKPIQALDVKNPLAPKKQGKVNTFKIGKYHYIPLDVIPKAYKPIFANKPVKVNNQTIHNSIIKINGGHYVPYTGKASKPVVIGGIKYIPVREATKAHNVSRSISTTFDGKVNTFKFGNKTYIPLAVIPKVYKAVFTHKITPLVKPVPRIVLKVNDSHFVPIQGSKVKPITKNNVTYIPVREVIDKKNIKNPIASKQKGDVLVFKIGNHSYIPLHVVPKVYAPIFKNKPVAATKENANNHVIKINGKTFRPILNETHKPVVINNVHYIPVHHIEAEQVGKKQVIAPNQVKKINTIKIGKYTYIPISVVPKVYRAVFTYKVLPLKSAVPKPITRVIKVNNAFYVPITKKSVKPIVVEGIKYVPVNTVSENVVIRKPIASKSKGTVNTFKLGNHTYIPLSVIPKVYKPIFLNKPVKVTKKSVSKTVITVNGITFVPITDKVHKVVVVKGIKYIPVKQVAKNSIKGNSTIHTNGQQINTFKIGTKTYIPLVVVPKAYRAVFTYKVKQTKKLSSANKIVIKVNGKHFSPITNKKVTPVIIDDVVYIPVKKTPSYAKVSSSIKAKNTGAKVNIIKIGKQTYIPLKVVPKAYKAIFVNKPVPVTRDTVRTTAIKINGKLYKPIANETHKQVVIGGVVYIPVHQSKSNDTIKRKIVINQDGHVHTFKIGSKTYIPLKVIPKAYSSVFQSKVKKAPKKPTVFKINGENYIPASPKNAKPVRIEGKTYVPVKVAPLQIDTTSPVHPKVEGQIHTFKIGNHTYVPLRVIPKVYRAVFRTKKQTKRTAPITTVIKINGEHFIPITIKKVVPIIKNGITYIPVKRAPLSLEITKSISPKKEGQISTFKVGKYDYIPLSVIPKVYKPIFKNTPVKVNKKSVSSTAIKINDLHYKPITTGRHKTVIIDGVKYIPVHLDNNVSNKNVLVPNSEGQVNTFKVGKIHYIPASVIPKSYKAVFKYKVQQKKSKTPAPKVILINDNFFIPAKNAKPIIIQGKHYIPVIAAPLKVDISNPIQPTKKGTIQTIKVGKITYVPLKVIPKKHRSSFKPTVKKTPLVVIKINGKIYKPIDKKTVKPIVKNGVTYLPVKLVKNTKGIKNTIKHKSKGPVHTFQVGKYTYIPVSVIPKVYAPIFRNKKVSVTKANAEKHAIKINGKTYKPITQGAHRQIVINGTTFIPVHRVKSSAGKSVISVNSPKKVNTFTVGKITYIPAHVVPKVYKALFKFKVLPYKKPVVPTTTIRINDEHYVPITNQTVNPVVIKGVKYIPVHSAPDTLEIHHPITPKTSNKTHTFKIGGKTYIPLSVIPKTFAPVFRNQKVAVNKNTLSKTVIQINGKHYLPINSKKHQSVVIEGRVYIPVRTAPKNKNLRKPIITNKEGQISTFKFSNITYIPLDVVPKVYRAVFKHKVASSIKPIATKTTVKKAKQSKPKVKVAEKSKPKVKVAKKSNPKVKVAKKSKPVVSPAKPVKQSAAPAKKVTKKQKKIANKEAFIPVKNQTENKQKLKRKQIPVKTIRVKKNQPVITVKGRNYIPIKDQSVKPINVNNQTYIPVQPYTKQVKKAKASKKNVTVKIGGQEYKPSKDITPIVIKNITYIPVQSIKKPCVKVSIKKSVAKPVTFGGRKFVPGPPVIIGGKQYIPVTPVGKKQANKNQTQIKLDKVKTIKVKGEQYKSIKNGKVIVIDGVHYIPVIAVTHPIIQINGKHYIPISKKSKPIVFDGKTYIPVKKATERQVRRTAPILPLNEGPIDTFVKGNVTYIPISVIPKKFRSVFKAKVVTKSKVSKPKAVKPNNPTHVIVINGKKYVPINNQTKKVLKFDGATYIPVYSAPKNSSRLIPVKTTFKGPVNTFKLGNITYIPFKAVPKSMIPIFKPVKKQVASPNPVIKINGLHYVPVKAGNFKPIVIDGVTFIPVRKASQKQIGSSTHISPKKQGQIDTFNVGDLTYVPLSVIPKIYKPLFKKAKKPVSPNNATHVIHINDQNYVPIRNKTVKPIIIDGVKYIPVYTAPAHKIDKLKSIAPTKSGKINTIKVGSITYIPASVIPKAFKKLFVPAKKSPSKNPVIIINGSHYVPLKNKSIKPIKIQDKVYVPVQAAHPDQIKKSKPISPKTKGKIDTITIKNITYIPLSVVPKAYKAVFKNVKKIVKPNNATHVIHINDQHYVPIRNQTVKPIVFDGVKYIPVYTAPAHKIDKLKSITPTKSGEIKTIKVGRITYIPASVIPKAFRKVFTSPKRKVSLKNPIISVGGAHYIPLKNKSVKPIKIEDATYIPVEHVDVENLNKSRIIVPKVHGKVEAIKVGNVYYIPLSVIPKAYRPVFRNKVIVKSIPNNSTHVINVNGKNYVPVNNQTLRPVIIGGIKYLPVYKAPASKLDSLLPITAKTSEHVDTFKIKNITYIPLTVIPKAYQPLFRTKVPVKQINDIIAPVFKNTTLPQLLINGEYFEPITWRAVRYHDANGTLYLPTSKVAPDNVDHSAVIYTPLKGNVIIINQGNVSYIPEASIPKNYIPIYRNTPTPVVIVSNTPYVPVQKQNVEAAVVDNVKYVPVQSVPEELENKPVFPRAFKVDQDSTFKIKNKLFVEVKKIPTALQPYFKNSSFIPGSKPEGYKPFGEDDDFCPCASARNSKISMKKRIACLSSLKSLSESCQENEQVNVAQVQKPKESSEISSQVQGKMFRSAQKSNETAKMI